MSGAKNDGRSGCPINLSIEVIGDRWSLLVIRDMMFGNTRHFRELLARSQEGIASNILASRLKLLERTGLMVTDFDVVESNEAFAAQACAVSKELGFDPAKVKALADHVKAKFAGKVYWQNTRPDNFQLYEEWWQKLRNA